MIAWPYNQCETVELGGTMRDLRQLDLNLLLSLDALLVERHVTRAAERIGTSQSAMSRALAKLRVLFGDPLLSRTATGLTLTPRAERLQPRLQAILREMRGLLQTPELDPSVLEATFRISTNDYCMHTLVTPILDELLRSAPGVNITLRRHAPGFPSAELDRDEADVILGSFRHRADVPGTLRRERLLTDEFVCVMRLGHPALDDGRLSLEAFVAAEHILVTEPSEGPGVVDHALQELSLQRRIRVRVMSFLSALDMLAHTDLLATLPSRLLMTAHDQLLSVPSPLSLPSLDVSAYWHPSRASDPRIHYLLDHLRTRARTLRTPPQEPS